MIGAPKPMPELAAKPCQPETSPVQKGISAHH